MVDLWLCVWPPGLFLYSRPWFGFCSFCLTAEEKAGVIKRTVTEAFEVSARNCGEEWGNSWVPSTWNSNYASALIFWILGACVQACYSQCCNREKKKFSSIITALMFRKVFIPKWLQRHTLLFFLSLWKSERKPQFQALIDIESNEQLLLLSQLMALSQLHS